MRIARLQRFYGGDPERWLQIPMALLRCYGNAMDRVDAEETVSQINARVMAQGSSKPSTLRRMWRHLMRRIGTKQKAQPASPAILKGIGVGFDHE